MRDGIPAQTYSGGGNAGNLTITTGQLLVSNGSRIDTGTSGAGHGGNLTIYASDSVQVIGTSNDGQTPSYLAANTKGTGDGGNLTITTGQLLVSNGAVISSGTDNVGNAGRLTVNASDSVQVIGTSANGQRKSSLSANTLGTGNGGELTITTGQLLISNGAQMSAGTTGAGNGGRLTINASDSVRVNGTSDNGQISSGLFAQTIGKGNAGELTITTGQLLVSDGALVSARTEGAGKGGSLTINASDSVQLSGTDSGLFVNATSGSRAGDLTVTTRQMSVSDGAQVTVSSPQGQAGNMNIQANSLHLNQGRLFAETAKSGSEGGANITLSGLDLLRMDNESLISANALQDANGGNITIDSTFIVATPPTGPNGSDITANAVRGNGGRVNITTQGLLGIELRPQLTPENDITVSSQFGLTGEFQLNSPDVDPSRGLTNLPTDVTDASNQIAQDCQFGGGKASSSFINTGRGGLPTHPYEPLDSNDILADVQPPTEWTSNSSGAASSSTIAKTTPKQIVEATGWIINENGQVVLVAELPPMSSKWGCRLH